MAMLQIYDQELRGYSQFLVNGNKYKIILQEIIFVVRYLNQGTVTTLLMLFD